MRISWWRAAIALLSLLTALVGFLLPARAIASVLSIPKFAQSVPDNVGTSESGR